MSEGSADTPSGKLGKINAHTTAIGHFESPCKDISFDVSLRLDMDRQKQCLQLVFVRDRKSIGYIPIEVKDRFFILRGISVNENLRGQGLSPIFVAIFLEICFILEVAPKTDRIDKPVISLVLQKFGFVPHNRGTEVEVAEGSCSTGGGGQIVLWSEDRARLVSTFGKRFLKSQNMVVVDQRPVKSRTVFVNTHYVPEDVSALRDQAALILTSGKLLLSQEPRATGLLRDLHAGGWPAWASSRAKAFRAVDTSGQPSRSSAAAAEDGSCQVKGPDAVKATEDQDVKDSLATVQRLAPSGPTSMPHRAEDATARIC